MSDFLVKLLDIAKLEDGWDSCGGKRITVEAIETAKNLIPVPVASGGLQIEIHAGGVDLEIEIAPSGQVVGIGMRRAA